MYQVTSLDRSRSTYIFVTLRRVFKKAGSILFDIGDSWDKEIYISRYLHIWDNRVIDLRWGKS